MNNKLILTDCDGVLLDWEFAFDIWMGKKGHNAVDNHKSFYRIEDRYAISTKDKRYLVRQFNESAAIGFLPPHRDAVHYVRKLHEQYGYIFHVITSLSNDRYAQELRVKNLKKLFGDTTFDRFVFLDTGADKDSALEEYKDSECIWVEDHIENVETGVELGLNSYLMEHKHNMHYDDVPRIKNWKELYTFITN